MNQPPYFPIMLNGKPVEKITAFLFHKGGNDDPKRLKGNENKSFQGSIVLGMGFTFDDSNEDATPISEMHRLIAENPKNAEVIFPYIGGAEVNSHPTHQHHRYVIDFFDRSEEECWQNYPELMQIIQQKVKPERDKQKRNALREYWWQYAEKRPGLKKAIAPLKRVLITNAQASVHLSFIFYPSDVVFANSLNIFPLDQYSHFAILQSQVHEIFARFFSSSLEDRLRYNPSDCFETFPFPIPLNSLDNRGDIEQKLEEIGQIYYEYRAKIMIENNQGLTQTYNRFHDPNEQEPAILKLRAYHEQMDRIVLEAYGWTDINLTCEFLLDYEDESENDDQGNKAKKKPWRYRWNEELHDEILGRLLDLNEQRYEEEKLFSKKADNKAQLLPKKRTRKIKSELTDTLFDVNEYQ